jgi:uncharacterized protein (TIGR03067 family)
MNVKLGCVMLTVLLGAGGAATDAKKDTAKFQGTWTVDTLTYDGKEHKLKFNIVFKGNDGTVKNNEKVQNEYAKIKFKLDPSSKPRSMDITITDGSQTDSTMKGIYEWKDDELRICAKVFGTERPKEFDAPEGSSTVLLVLKRVSK